MVFNYYLPSHCYIQNRNSIFCCLLSHLLCVPSHWKVAWHTQHSKLICSHQCDHCTLQTVKTVKSSGHGILFRVTYDRLWAMLRKLHQGHSIYTGLTLSCSCSLASSVCRPAASVGFVKQKLQLFSSSFHLVFYFFSLD